MARAGQELVNPATGLRTVFRHTAEDNGGELLQVDWIGAPGWSTGPDHVHPLQAERFEVISGELGLRVSGEERTLRAGEAIEAAAGEPHAAWTVGEEEVHVLVDFRRRCGPSWPSRRSPGWRATARPRARAPPRTRSRRRSC